MAFLATNLLQAAIQKVGSSLYYRVKATGGGVTSFVSSTLEDRFTDDALKGGTCIVTRDAGGAGAAPEGEWSYISAYASATWTGTIDTITTAIASGDELMLVMPNAPLVELISLINSSLQTLGDIDLVDTSLTSSASLTYTLPVALKREDPIKIELYNGVEYKEIPRDLYYVVPSAPGSTATLAFRDYLDSGFTMRIWYKGVHPAITAYSSPIAESIPLELVTLQLASDIFSWIGVNDGNREAANKIQADLQTARNTGKIWRVPRKNKLLTWNRIKRDDYSPGDPNREEYP